MPDQEQASPNPKHQQAVTVGEQHRRLLEVVETISGLYGINASCISAAARNIIKLLAARWQHITDVAYDGESEQKATISFLVRFDFSNRVPTGDVTLSFVKRTRDMARFNVEDPNQIMMGFETSQMDAEGAATDTMQVSREWSSHQQSTEGAQ